jgi:hypothetical protein
VNGYRSSNQGSNIPRMSVAATMASDTTNKKAKLMAERLICLRRTPRFDCNQSCVRIHSRLAPFKRSCRASDKRCRHAWTTNGQTGRATFTDLQLVKGLTL